MLGKRLWLDVEQLSLSDHRSNKKSAACSEHDDSPTVLQKSAVCKKNECMALSIGMLSPEDSREHQHRVKQQPERPLDKAYRKHLFRYVLQQTGHDVLLQRVSLKNMVQICHLAWNGDEDDDSFF